MKRIVSSALIYCFFATNSFAQKQNGSWDNGEQSYARQEYALAVDFYKRLITNKTYSVKALQRIVQCYRNLNEDTEALYFARQLWKKSQTDSSSALFATVLKENGYYMEAKRHFVLLTYKYPGRLDYTLHTHACDTALIFRSKGPSSKVINLRQVNTEYSEISPTIDPNGALVFSSNREGIIIKRKTATLGSAYYDLYQSRLGNEGNYGSPILFASAINSIDHEFAPSFSKTGDTLFFTKSMNRNNATKDTVNRLKLYSSFRKGQGDWEQSHIFILNDSLFSFGHPFMEPSGKMFFFASNMKGGYGGSDIYVCFRKDSLWSRPVNLGPVINSSANETYPSYHDGDLYFSSDRPLALGGYDIFKAKQQNGDWTKVVNLGWPINSPSDDFALTFNATYNKWYFTSNRLGGKGKEDIYLVIF